MIENTAANRSLANRSYSHAEQLSVFYKDIYKDVDSIFMGPASEQRFAKRDYLAPAGQRQYSPQRDVYRTLN